MILQALHDYYDRRRTVDPDQVPQWGFERKPIPFLIVFDRDGRFLNIEDTRDDDAGFKKGRVFTVPATIKRAGPVIRPQLLWDRPDYALGFVPKGKREDRVAAQHEAFIEQIDEVVGEVNEPAVIALKNFLQRDDRDAIWEHPLWDEVTGHTGAVVSFRMIDDLSLVAENPRVRDAVLQASAAAPSELRAQCLITGERAPIAVLHPVIKGVRGGQPGGANIVSFNLDSVETHGREQGSNAPVSQRAAFAYTTALNLLLHPKSSNKAHVGDTTVVFWPADDTPVEDLAGSLFQDDEELLADPDRGVEKLRAIYQSPWQGNPPLAQDGGDQFFVLGLAPNVSRISIRFWRPTTVGKFAEAVLAHFDDVDIVRPPWASPYPSVRSLLRSTAVLGKDDNIAPKLAGDVLDAIVSGRPYPRRLLSAAVQRIRAEQDVSPDRAALIKGSLIRLFQHSPQRPEVNVALDATNENVGYRLGRLFAVLERAQERASPGVKSGIRERYYSSASATPVAAFPTLMKLKNHHLAKIEHRGAVVALEKLLGSIIDGIEEFPRTLPIEEQGRFAIGYYHQRQDFYRKSDDESEEENDG